MSEPYIGEIRIFAGNFAPQNWAFCDGQIMSIAENTPLFSLLGTTYGGDGVSTFALPDLRGRVPISQGQGPGLSSRVLGTGGGAETVVLTPANLHSHAHAAMASTSAGDADDPTGRTWAPSTALQFQADGGAGYPNATAPLSPAGIGSTGGNAAHENMPPYLGVNFIIALYGIFPARS